MVTASASAPAPAPAPVPSPSVTMESSSSPLSSVPGSAPSSPSSPLSNLSKTPSLPDSPELSPTQDPSRRYPSPTSTTASGTQSPMKSLKATDSLATNRSRPAPGKDAGDGAPPAKKRKVAAAPKERRTDYIDLTKPQSEWTAEDEGHLKRLMSALQKKKKIVVIAGAGISVSAGIPDFRSSTGLFAPAGSQQQKMKASGKHLFDASVYRNDASTQSFHTMVREMADMAHKAQPTPFHHLLASLAQEGRLLRLYSQNIDCIDTSMEPLSTNVPLNAKGPWPTTIQLHGGLDKMVCTKCAELNPFDGKLFEGPKAPLCESCRSLDETRTTHAGKRSHGIGRLRPRFVLYNEYNPDEEAIGNVSSADLKARPDAVLVVGTSLKVPGTRRLVKEMYQVTRGRRDGITAFINTDSEPKGVDFKDCWDLVVRAKCDKVALQAGMLPWDCKVGEDYSWSANDADRLKGKTLEIGIPSKPHDPQVKTEAEAGTEVGEQLPAKTKVLDEVQAMPTPRASPKPTASKQAGKKTKQPTIPWAKPQTETAEQAARNKNKKPRKPLTTKRPTNTTATSTVASAFKAVKNTADGSSTTKSSAATKHKSSQRASLPPLRPERKDSADSFTYFRESPHDESGVQSTVEPTTPIQAERPTSRDTISPKSVPRGMDSMLCN